MRGRLRSVLAALFALASLACWGDQPLTRDILQHLDLARKCASSGQVDGALAHAAVVSSDRKLKVRVDCAGFQPADQGLFRNALSAAFSMWQGALGEMPFEITESDSADVVIHFMPRVNDRGIDVCGHSSWTRGVLNPETNPTVFFRAEVMVRIVKPNGQNMSFEQIRSCVAHELGHVLGLDDSGKQGDLMGPMDFAHPVETIKSKEVEALIRARSEAAAIRRDFTAKRGR